MAESVLKSTLISSLNFVSSNLNLRWSCLDNRCKYTGNTRITTAHCSIRFTVQYGDLSGGARPDASFVWRESLALQVQKEVFRPCIPASISFTTNRIQQRGALARVTSCTPCPPTRLHFRRAIGLSPRPSLLATITTSSIFAAPCLVERQQQRSPVEEATPWQSQI